MYAMEAMPFPDFWGQGNNDGGKEMRGRLRKLEEDITDIRIDVAVIKSNYVTKEDLGAFREEMKEDISALREGGKEDAGALRSELKKDISALREEMKEVKESISILSKEVKEDNFLFREEVKSEHGIFRKEINDLKIAISDTRTLISDTRSSIIMWVVSAVIFAQLIPAIPAILKVFFPS